MKHVIFFSGPHGSGKTTLIQSLVAADSHLIENTYDVDFLKEFPSIKQMNSFERCLLRLYHRLYVAKHVTMKSIDSDQTVLVSRSVYDSLAYSSLYHSLGQIDDSHYHIIEEVADSRDPSSCTVILNPPVSVIMKRLDHRRKTGVRNERDRVFSAEDTLEFVTALHDRFEQYKNDTNVLYLEDNSPDEIQKVLRWIQQ